MFDRSRFFAISACLAVVCGCGQGDLNLAIATGQVIYKGSPVEGAQVQFLGKDAPRPGAGVTDKDGRFVISTYRFKDGAMIGPNVVTITKVDPSSLSADSEAMPPASGGDPGSDPTKLVNMGKSQIAAAKSKTKSGGPKHLIPEKYSDPKRSKLTADVQAGKSNEFLFELAD